MAPLDFAIGNIAYIGTGYDNGNEGYRNDFCEYNPTLNIWSKKNDFKGVARYHAVGFVRPGL
ncbi:MAG: hypothetical protein H0W62_04280 [Chitinophagales bacterium]|nr:hypothetical protein [Chitinophagales bacterium]